MSFLNLTVVRGPSKHFFSGQRYFRNVLKMFNNTTLEWSAPEEHYISYSVPAGFQVHFYDGTVDKASWHISDLPMYLCTEGRATGIWIELDCQPTLRQRPEGWTHNDY